MQFESHHHLSCSHLDNSWKNSALGSYSTFTTFFSFHTQQWLCHTHLLGRVLFLFSRLSQMIVFTNLVDTAAKLWKKWIGKYCRRSALGYCSPPIMYRPLPVKIHVSKSSRFPTWPTAARTWAHLRRAHDLCLPSSESEIQASRTCIFVAHTPTESLTRVIYFKLSL